MKILRQKYVFSFALIAIGLLTANCGKALAYSEDFDELPTGLLDTTTQTTNAEGFFTEGTNADATIADGSGESVSSPNYLLLTSPSTGSGTYSNVQVYNVGVGSPTLDALDTFSVDFRLDESQYEGVIFEALGNSGSGADLISNVLIQQGGNELYWSTGGASYNEEISIPQLASGTYYTLTETINSTLQAVDYTITNTSTDALVATTGFYAMDDKSGETVTDFYGYVIQDGVNEFAPTNLEIDNIAYGAAPEPQVYMLLLVGVVIVIRFAGLRSSRIDSRLS